MRLHGNPTAWYLFLAPASRAEISASSCQPRHRNTRKITDVILRPKSTGNNTARVAHQEMYRRIALKSFLCRFPSWSYARRWCRCCHLLISIIRIRYVASGMYMTNSTKKLGKIIGFKLNDRNLFPGQIPRRVFLSGRWEMWQTNVLYKLNTNVDT